MSNILAVTYEDAPSITQSDTIADPAGPFAGIFTGSGGTIKLTTIRGTTQTLNNVAAGIVMPIATQRVWSSVTSATGIVGLTAPAYRPTINPGTGSVV